MADNKKKTVFYSNIREIATAPASAVARGLPAWHTAPSVRRPKYPPLTVRVRRPLLQIRAKDGCQSQNGCHTVMFRGLIGSLKKTLLQNK